MEEGMEGIIETHKVNILEGIDPRFIDKMLMCMSIEKMQGYTPEEKNKIYGIYSFMMDHYGQTRTNE